MEGVFNFFVPGAGIFEEQNGFFGEGAVAFWADV